MATIRILGVQVVSMDLVKRKKQLRARTTVKITREINGVVSAKVYENLRLQETKKPGFTLKCRERRNRLGKPRDDKGQISKDLLDMLLPHVLREYIRKSGRNLDFSTQRNMVTGWENVYRVEEQK